MRSALLMNRLLKPAVFVLALSPFLWLVFRAFTERLSANPVEDLTLTTGIWALRFLLVTLAITPIRRITGWHRIIQFRRMFGLFAFFYASVHLLIYIVFDQALAFKYILPDLVKRPYITAGMTAFLLMLPLADHLDEGMDSPARPPLAGAAPAGLLQRVCRLPALHLEGQGGDWRARVLRRYPRDLTGLPADLALPLDRPAGGRQPSSRDPRPPPRVGPLNGAGIARSPPFPANLPDFTGVPLPEPLVSKTCTSLLST